MHMFLYKSILLLQFIVYYYIHTQSGVSKSVDFLSTKWKPGWIDKPILTNVLFITTNSRICIVKLSESQGDLKSMDNTLFLKVFFSHNYRMFDKSPLAKNVTRTESFLKHFKNIWFGAQQSSCLDYFWPCKLDIGLVEDQETRLTTFWSCGGSIIDVGLAKWRLFRPCYNIRGIFFHL